LIELRHYLFGRAGDRDRVEHLWVHCLHGALHALFPAFYHGLDLCFEAIAPQHLRVVDAHLANVVGKGSRGLETYGSALLFVRALRYDGTGDEGRNDSAVRGMAREARAFVKLLAQLAPLIARPVGGQHAIGDLAALHNVFWPYSRDVDRQVRARWSETQFEASFKVEEFTVIDELLTAQDHPDDLDVLTRALHRFFKGDAVPVFDNIDP